MAILFLGSSYNRFAREIFAAIVGGRIAGVTSVFPPNSEELPRVGLKRMGKLIKIETSASAYVTLGYLNTGLSAIENTGAFGARFEETVIVNFAEPYQLESLQRAKRDLSKGFAVVKNDLVALSEVRNAFLVTDKKDSSRFWMDELADELVRAFVFPPTTRQDVRVAMTTPSGTMDGNQVIPSYG